MIKGWRLVFYALIAAAVLAIATITIKFILTERLVKNTGDPELAVRQAAARKIMGHAEDGDRQRKKAMEFLSGQPRTVRNNVVWSIERMILDGEKADVATEWLVDIACDLSGELPTGDADTDSARLAVQRIGEPTIQVLIDRLGESTQRTLEKDTYAHRRAVAARLLGVLEAKQATEALIHALRDPFENVRQQAAAALARLGTPEAKGPLQAYLEPYFAVLQGKYVCYVRADAYGRLRNDPNRDDLIYGPFVVTVKPHVAATEADLERQRDSAEEIIKKEERRQAATKERLEKGRMGQIIKTVKGPTDLKVTKVALRRTQLEVTDPAGDGGKFFDVIEGEPLEVIVDVKNMGPGDIVQDFFVAAYGASPPPKNHVDRPAEGPYRGERAEDNRSLVQGEARHLQTMYAHDLPSTKDEDDSQATMYITLRFNTLEADQIEALRQLKYVGDASAVPALGDALQDRSYTVRSEAAMALQRILQAKQTDATARQGIVGILRERGLTSPDPVVRYRAAEALLYASDSQTAQALQGLLLNDTDPTVRLVATRALAGTKDVDRERMLPALVSADAGVRLMAPRLFGQTAEDAVIARGLLQTSQDPEVAREVLRSASRLLTTADLIAALALPDPAARTLAVQILALRSDPEAKTALMRSLDDEEGDVRAAAASGLGELLQKESSPDNAVVERLIQVIEGEAGDYVGVPVGEEPEDPATAVITDKQSRAAAAAALVGTKSPEAIQALKDAFTDTNPDVLAAVMPAVADGSLGDQSERLIAIIEDVTTPMPVRIRQAGILAMWSSGASSEEALDSLVGLLNDPNDTIKTASAVALIGLGDSRGEKVLRDQLTSKQADVRRGAATLLATRPDEKVQAIKGIKDEDRDGLNILIEELYLTGSLPVNFRFLCRSLIFLGDQPRTVDRLLEGLKDPHPVLRAASLQVLSALRHEGIEATAVEMLSDRNELVRAAAAQAVAELRLQSAMPELDAMVAEHPDACETVQTAVQEAIAQLTSRS